LVQVLYFDGAATRNWAHRSNEQLLNLLATTLRAPPVVLPVRSDEWLAPKIRRFGQAELPPNLTLIVPPPPVGGPVLSQRAFVIPFDDRIVRIELGNRVFEVEISDRIVIIEASDRTIK
jgi:hypothetical protein